MYIDVTRALDAEFRRSIHNFHKNLGPRARSPEAQHGRGWQQVAGERTLWKESSGWMAIIDMRQMIGPASENMHASSMLMVSEECRILASRTASVRAPSLMPCSSRSSRAVHSCAAAVYMHGPPVSRALHITTAGGGHEWRACAVARRFGRELVRWCGGWDAGEVCAREMTRRLRELIRLARCGGSGLTGTRLI